ncbi:MAG: hypothetical protein K8F33_00355, partial [Thermomonas sp.]|nr:hypothetical protein [Thermomonas sp.]
MSRRAAEPKAPPPKRRWRALFVALTALVLLIVMALLWLLNTDSGRDFALRQLVARLSTGSTLRWNSAQGHLSGPLRLAGVQFTTPVQRDDHCQPMPASPCATGTLRLDIAETRLDAALLPLLARRLRLDQLLVHGARLDLPRDDSALELPDWPE